MCLPEPASYRPARPFRRRGELNAWFDNSLDKTP